ncbi:MAG: AraC family transcriptional regulator [Chitinophagales bacterium]|nr:AraC family transcriptional regulator [Bacteroidota bacterium]
MPQQFKLKSIAPSEEKSLKTLVENRKIYSLNFCELNLFETFKESALVPLTFGDFVVTSMLRGKKVMHLYDNPGFDYLPGETVLVPANVTMKIDFPEATKNNPTQCIALALESQKIQQIVNRLNEDYPKNESNDYWQLRHNEYHFQNNYELATTINKLIDVCSSGDREKDILADIALKELVVRIIQSQNLNVEDKSTLTTGRNPLSFVMNYIRVNINQQFQISDLSTKACMSVPTFYRAFKNEFGLSPLEYILREKIKKAKTLLADYNMTITHICYETGFSSLNYFDRQFKRIEGVTPKQYRAMVLKQRDIN